ncbi:MAG: tetratricopeptide repeat protein [Lachnospiraceae bacterium]|nr:tetratricopeptide repeat protein [Lachnospiraceae bacterium]
MKCCKCNTEITGRKDTCPVCGMRLKEYRRMVYLSNGLYNSALERARRKDLSGAVPVLKRCLELNKHQIQARNLYGLILYELGEAGEAARQWKLSMALDPEDKQAARLYKKTIGSRAEIARMKDAAGKYNQALRCAREGALDLAIVHLKKVLSVYPHYAAAAKLMALICIKQEDYARACRVLGPLLQFDVTDKQALRYMEEASALGGGTLKADIREQEEREQRESQDVIIPPYSEKNELLHDFLCILGGLALGVLACIFLIFPSVKQSMIEDSNGQIMEYSSSLSSKEVEILSLEKQIEDLNTELEDTQNSLKAYTEKNGILDAYTNLLSSMNYYVNGDYLEAAQSFAEIDSKAVKNSAYKTAYETMSQQMESTGLKSLYDEGMRLYKRYNYEEAEKYFKQCLKIKSDYPEVMYWLGLCYYNSGDRENAQKYFYKVQKDYPDTTWSKNSKRVMPYTESDESSASGESSGTGESSASGQSSSGAGQQ